MDNITYSMLQNLTLERGINLLDIFNNILRGEEEIPEEWKNQIVIPLIKENKDPNVYSFYRPITLTSCVAKTFESLIKNRIEHLLEKCNTFHSLQNGFRKGRVTENLVTTEIYNVFSINNKTICCFIDVLGAYDNINLAKQYEILGEAQINEDI